MRILKTTFLFLLFIVLSQVSTAQVGSLHNDEENVHWAEPIETYPAELDLDRNRILDVLDLELQMRTVPDMESVEIVVILFDKPGDEDIAVFEALGGQVINVWQHATYGWWGRLPWSRIEDLSALYRERLCIVQKVEKDGILDMDLATQIVRVRNQTWVTYGYEGDEDGSLAIIDLGIDGSHNDLADPDNDNQFNDPDDWNEACGAGGWNATYRIQGWWWETGTSQNPVDPTGTDPKGHGTAVAGCAAGDGTINSNLKGIAPKSHIVGVRISGESSTQAINAMNTIIANKGCAKIKAANLSSSYDPSNPSLIVDAARNVVANGIVLICSAGNGYDNGPGYQFYYVMYPGCADRVITVGATNDLDQVAGYSSNGPSGVAKPDVVAPGGGLNETEGRINTCDNSPDDTYRLACGTSFSAPIVCGAASLLIDAWEKANSFSWSWTIDEALKIKSVLLMTAVEIDTVGEDPPGGQPPNSPNEPKDRGGHDRVEGYGRINVDAAVEALTMELSPGVVMTEILGSGVTDKKVWARRIQATGPCVKAVLEVPQTGDFDLYLYNEYPNTSGVPIIRGSSVSDAMGNTEEIQLDIGYVSEYFYLVVKWVYGDGSFKVHLMDSWVNFVDATTSPLGSADNNQGLAWGDYDNDGDTDLYISTWGGANKLYRNDGDGSFTDVTSGTPLGDASNGQGVAWGDYDNDGDLDLYLANHTGTANKLFRNEGGGTFTDVTSTAGVGDTGDGRAVNWVDYDCDANIDLYVVNRTSANKLFHNQGNGTFADATSGTPLGDTGVGLCAAWGDYDNDGDPDLYLTNNGTNKLFRNDGSGTFTDVTAWPVNDGAWGNGIDWGDYDNDGDLDLYLANGGVPNKLFQNDGLGGFTDVTSSTLGDNGRWGYGVAWGDYDNDGDLDLYVANAGSQPNRLFRNDGGTNFVEVASGTSLADSQNGLCTAWADYDNDGGIDIYFTNTEPDKLFRNVVCDLGHWIHLDLRGISSNASAIGARVRIVAGGISQIREVSGGSGFLSQNSLTVEFGLGAATVVDTLEIRWPSGLVEYTVQMDVDQHIVVEEGNLTGIGVLPSVLSSWSYPNPFSSATTIWYYLPKHAAVTLRIYDISGRLVRVFEDAAMKNAGRHQVIWDGKNKSGRNVAPGVYFCNFNAGSFKETKKIVLLR
jgi:hypothetical protein